jgi:hypothetical protein
MKKIIASVLFLFMLSVASAQTFDGVFIGGNITTVVDNFKNKGYKVVKVINNSVRLEGFMGQTSNYVDLWVTSSIKTRQVWKVSAYITNGPDDFSGLKASYLKYKEGITNKYGTPTSSYEYFKSPYYEGDGYEETAVTVEKAVFSTFWLTDKNVNISVEISKYKQIKLTYENNTNSEIADKEMKSAESNSL